MKSFFFKSGLMAVTLAFALSFTGCSNSDDDPVYKDGCFKYDDKTYNSLNAAIRAALDNQEEKEDIIYLLDDVLDNEPLSINAEEYDVVTFNLGKFTYVSANGLDFKDVQLNLSGEGSFECRNGALSSASRIEVAEDFKGKITAPVTLDEAVMAVSSPKATVNVSQLKLAGNGIFSMEAVSEKPASVVIDRLSASGDSKVCAIDGESVVIKEGGKAHIHNYKVVSDVPANCLNAGYKVYQCEECKDDYVDFKEGEAGSCIAEDLIHHDAVEPTFTEYGNIEYWECPDCGADYSDKEGKHSVYPTLLPKNYDLPLDVLFACDDVWEQQNFDPFEFVFGFIKELIASKFEVSNEQLLDEMRKLSAKIDQLSNDVAKLRDAVDGLYRETRNITLGRALGEYTDKIVSLQNTTLKYYQYYQNIMNDKDKVRSLEEKNEEIKKLFEDFDKEFGGSALDAVLLSILKFYCETPSIEQLIYKNVPEAQEQFTQNIFLWEHLGYNVRKSLTLTDFQRLSSSYFIINAYLKWTGKPQNSVQMENLKTYLQKYQDTWEADIQRMKDRDEKYRIFSGGKPGELVYYPKGWYQIGKGIQQWFDSESNRKKYYFPRDNRNNDAVKSCEKVLEDVGLKDGFFEHRHLVDTYEKYKDKIGANTTENTMNYIGFDKMPIVMWEKFIVERTGEECYDKFGHYGNDDITLPHYKIFHCYKHKTYSSWFKTNYVVQINHRETNFLTDYDIRTNMGMWAVDGYISDPGLWSNWSFYTIRKLKDVK